MGWRHLDIRLCNWLIVGISMMMSGYFGWAIMGGGSIFAGGMAVMCAIVCYLVSYFAQDASKAFKSGHFVNFISSVVLCGVAIAFNIVSDYSTASIFRDQLVVATDNNNTVAENARTEVSRLEKAIANLREETAWRTKYESPETYDAMINQQKQIVDRGRNVYQRTKECTDTTLPISSQVCQAIDKLKADQANAVRRQIILSELKTLGEQLKTAKGEVSEQKVVANPAQAQVQSITTWFLLDRQTTDRTDWWGAKAIMLYMTVLSTAIITYLGFRIGALAAHYEPDEPPPARVRHNRWLPPPEPERESHPPIALKAEPVPPSPSSSSSYTIHKTSISKPNFDQGAIDRLMQELEDDFGLQRRH